MNILVTGGHGFIGSAFIKHIINKQEVDCIVDVDCPTRLSAAADRNNIRSFKDHHKYKFYDVWLETILNTNKFEQILKKHQITHIIHFAAETHVDNSISDPGRFIQSNIVGTFNLLEFVRKFTHIRFHHISTDEVYGHLGLEGKFVETTPYNPSSPYSASKASSDMLVRSYFRTFNLPVTISNCSNNYGPNQHKEKFIPVVVNSILNKQKIPVYGTGANIRDWIYVDDHCDAVWNIVTNGKLGETYNIGGNCEKTNLEIIATICEVMNVAPLDYIEFVEDRKGHDFRYAIDNSKIHNTLGWSPKMSFLDGIKKTVEFYSTTHSNNRVSC